MNNTTNQRTVGWPIIVVGGIALVAAAAVAVRAMPEDSAIGRVRREAEEIVAQLPDRARRLKSSLDDRYRRARSAFYLARSDSERLLTAQFEEAKQRGSVPPV